MTATGPGLSPALASSYTSGSGPASFGVGVGAAPLPTNPGTTGSAGIINGSYGLPDGQMHALAAPAAPANPYQGYIDAFNQSMLTSRAGIDKGLHQALGELSGRRDAAAQVAAGLPGQVQSAYAGAAANERNAQGALQGALSPDVKGDAAAVFAPYQQALLQDKAGADALGPFVALAQRANYDSGQSALENTALQGQQGVDAEQRQFLMGLAQQQGQHQQSVDDRAAQWAHDEAWAKDPSNPGSIPGQLQVDQAKYQQSIDAQPAAAANLQGTGLTTGDVNTIRSTPTYARFKNAITSNELNPDMIARQLQTEDPKLLTLLQAENPAYFKNAKLNIAHGGGTWGNIKPDFDYTPSPVVVPFGTLKRL